MAARSGFLAQRNTAAVAASSLTSHRPANIKMGFAIEFAAVSG
jgi:hypothetical protein